MLKEKIRKKKLSIEKVCQSTKIVKKMEDEIIKKINF